MATATATATATVFSPNFKIESDRISTNKAAAFIFKSIRIFSLYPRFWKNQCFFFIFILCAVCPARAGGILSKKNEENKGSVIFIHPDGMSLAHWDAVRLIHPNHLLHFDLLPHMAVYRGVIRDQLTATSNAGATIHAFGVRTGRESFGMDGGKKISAKSGDPHSILISAKKQGLSVALCQSGILVEPGTAAFAAQVLSRKNKDKIARQIIEADLDIVLGGGEKYLLPKGVQGRFGLGGRLDGVNLIQQARRQGYLVIYDLKNFDSKMKKAEKILGVFAHEDTYNDETQEILDQKGWDHYQKNTPTIAQMTDSALKFLKHKGRRFLIVVEEEGTDNFSNKHNTLGFLKAGQRADDALGVARSFLKKNPKTLLLTTSDSNASGLIIKDKKSKKKSILTLYSRAKEASTVFPFTVVWADPGDVSGGVVVKAEGMNARHVRGLMENTQIYDLMYLTLFGRFLK